MTPLEAVTLLNTLYEDLRARRRSVDEEERYYRGEAKLRFASERWADFHASRYKDFSDNWAAPVANSPAERLGIDGFRLDDDPETSPAERELWNDWLLNDMEMQSSQGLLTSIIAGRSFVTVWGQPTDERGDLVEGPADEPVAYWEHPSQVTVSYDPETPRRRAAGLKTWSDDTTEYATLYTPGEVWKFHRPRAFAVNTTSGLQLPPEVTSQGGWDRRQPPSDDVWPLPNPLGEVPIVEFPNRPMLAGGPISEIRGVMAMQDAINLLWAYLFNAADFASMPARVVMGQDMPRVPVLDDSGQVIGERHVDLRQVAEDRILWLTGENTKIGQWDAAKLDIFTGVIETAVTHIAAQTRTPPHYLILGKGMVNINADGIKAAEAGLVNKVSEMQRFYGPSAREVFRLMALVRGNTGAAGQARLGTVSWRDPQNRSEAQLTDSLQKMKAVGFPFEWLAEQYGLGQTEIARVMAMKEREESDPTMERVLREVTPLDGQQPADAAVS